MKKKFVSIIWGYHKQIFLFGKDQHYHMQPIQAMIEEGYKCEIFSIDSSVKIEDDPNFIKGVKVIYYKNIALYLLYLIKNRNSIIYSNTITIKTLIVGLFGKKTVFYPHTNPFGQKSKLGNIKRIISYFFYLFYKKIRINNKSEKKLINKIKNNLAIQIPLSLSNNFYVKDLKNRKSEIVWIGNIHPIKNPLLIVKVAEILKQKKIKIIIRVIGEDRYKKYSPKSFSEIVKEKKLEKYVKVLGYKAPDEIQKILSKSMFLLNTSFDEGQCLAVYEGSLAGNALLLPNILAFPSVFKTNALYHSNVNDIVKNIRFYLENKEQKEKMIRNNQKMISKNYNYKLIKNKLKKMFLNL